MAGGSAERGSKGEKITVGEGTGPRHPKDQKAERKTSKPWGGIKGAPLKTDLTKLCNRKGSQVGENRK